MLTPDLSGLCCESKYRLFRHPDPPLQPAKPGNQALATRAGRLTGLCTAAGPAPKPIAPRGGGDLGQDGRCRPGGSQAGLCDSSARPPIHSSTASPIGGSSTA